MLTQAVTHVTTMIDRSKTSYCGGFIVQTSATHSLEKAESVASYWMRETTNINHVVVISQVIETRSIDATLKVTKP
jgi:hypothetical protein